MAITISLAVLQLGILLGLTTASPHSTPYSLQAAVDALHRRESQLSSNHDLHGNHESNFEDNEGTNHRTLNHLLSNYLGRDEVDQRFDERDFGEEYLPEFDDREEFFDDEEFGPEDKKRKRSMFREREEQQPSVFREREYGHPSTLDEDFLREMDRERNIDRDRKYHALIKQIWGKYKHDDEELERQLLRNELEHTREMQDEDNYPDMSEEDDEFYKKKRSMKKKRMMFAPMIGYPSAITAGYYGSPGGPMNYQKKKRDYPMLPWLPASRKKRFPVAKRSPRSNEFHDMTDEKVAHDLKEIFGEVDDDDKKKKRSPDDLFGMDKKRTQETEEEKKKRMVVKKSDELEEEKKKKSVKKSVEEEEDKKKRTVKKIAKDHEEDDKKKKRDDDDKKKKRTKKDRFIDDDADDDDKKKKRSVKRKRNSDDKCDDEYCDEPHDHYADSEEEDSEEENEDDEEEETDENDDERRRRKKKRDVKKRKRANMEVFREDQVIPGDLMDVKKRDTTNWSRIWGMDRRKKSTGSSSRDYPLSFYKNYEEDRRRNLDLSKIENMDHKLKTIEDLLIDETIKYTGAHEGIVEPEDIKELKDHVVSRLATAYNLEKMRHALDKIKNNMEQEQHLEANEIPEDSDEKKAKRVAIKKEKVEFDHSGHKPEDAPKKVEHEEPENDMDDADEKKKKKKKKRNGIEDLLEEGGAALEALSDQCTILDNLEKRCKGVDALSGDLHQDLLPACGVHQLCYLCGTSQSECDFQYLADAETICGHHLGCQSAARSALMILRGFPSPTLGPRECAKNPCLYQALKDIGV